MSTKPTVIPPKLYTYQEWLILKKSRRERPKDRQEQIANKKYSCQFCMIPDILKNSFVIHYRKGLFHTNIFLCSETCANLWILKNGTI